MLRLFMLQLLLANNFYSHYNIQVDVAKVQTVALLFEAMVFCPGGVDQHTDPLRLHSLLATIFAW